jgi:competence protein ComEC
MKYYLGIIFLLITLSATPCREVSNKNYVVIWNTGQGQWITSITNETCLHFDVGGEHFPWQKISYQCRHKENHIYLSHWDWDHIGGLSHWPHWPTCMALEPLGKTTTSKFKLIKKIKHCSTKKPDSQNSLWTWSSQQDLKDTNSLSHVSRYHDFLIPGDSPKAQELIWMHQPWISQSKILILGHHGSHTSTSKELLLHLPQLKMAVASARWHRYHHPHAQTEAILRRFHIPLLRTEDWGHIWFEQ